MSLGPPDFYKAIAGVANKKKFENPCIIAIVDIMQLTELFSDFSFKLFFFNLMLFPKKTLLCFLLKQTFDKSFSSFSYSSV
jgi:hypothetical protein